MEERGEIIEKEIWKRIIKNIWEVGIELRMVKEIKKERWEERDEYIWFQKRKHGRR